jgi:nitroreductase
MPAIENVDEVLATTRAVRKRLDLERPVPRKVIEECLELATQAPAANNVEDWRFVVIDDEGKRAAIADVYRKAWEDFVVKPMQAGSETLKKRLAAAAGTGPARERQQRILASAEYLVSNLHRVPVHAVACTAARSPKSPTGAVASGYYGSIYPAIWSFQLALRARGLGSSLTCLHLHYADEVAAIARIPDSLTQVALLPVAYSTGPGFRRAARRPISDIAHWDGWEQEAEPGS